MAVLQSFLSPELRRVRIAVVAIVALNVLALALGFIEEDLVVVLGVVGLYLTLPMVAIVALVLLAVERIRSPRRLRALGIFLIAVTLPYALFWALWVGPLMLPPVVVVLVVCRRLFTAANLRA